MEEEIIIPEEETFDYHKLRYILDGNGYIIHASIGGLIICDLGECTEYNGEVPADYESIEEWFEEENEKLNAWKIVDGNLAFDPNRYEILQAQYKKEEEDNRYVCHKEISNITNLIKTDSVDNYKRSTTGLSNLLEATDSNIYVSEYIELVAKENLTGSVTLKFNNGNLLTNDATSKTESGISFVVNADRSITINGTATEDIEFDIGGTNINTKPILTLKKGTNYYLSSNGYQIKMYNYDGTDRTEVYNGTGGVINLSSDSKVTNIVLSIPNGKTIDTTIYPMLNLGIEADKYVTYQGNECTIYLEDKTFNNGDNIKIENGNPVLQNEIYIGDNITIGNDFVIGGDLIRLNECVMPYTYLNKTYMYAYDDIDLMVTYPNTEKNVDLCGYETPNGGFGVDEEGNMYANNGTFRGNIYFPNSDSKIIGGDGLLTNLQFRSQGYYYGFELLGFEFDTLNDSIWRKRNIPIIVNIPNGFKITKATATIIHSRNHAWSWNNSSYSGTTGYCRNIHLYKSTDNKAPSYYNSQGSAFVDTSTLSGEVISSAFGSNGYTASSNSQNNDIYEYAISNDISSSLSVGTNVLFLSTTNTTTSTSQSSQDADSKTGMVQLVIDVIGYMSYES